MINVPRVRSFGSPFFGQPAFVFVAPAKISGLLELTIDRNRLILTGKPDLLTFSTSQSGRVDLAQVIDSQISQLAELAGAVD
jgi:hypothetical protein